MARRQNRVAAPWARLTIMAVALAGAAGISWKITGSLLPTESGPALIFQSSLLLVVLGSSLLERPTTKPAEALVNGLMGMLSLVTIYTVAPKPSWWVVVGYCAFVLLLGLACVGASEGRDAAGWRSRVAGLTYGPATLLGRGRVLFSVVFLYAVVAFYGLQGENTAVLVLFWGLFIVLWPLQVPEALTKLAVSRKALIPAGKVVRVDSPGLVRVELPRGAAWPGDGLLAYRAGSGQVFELGPLYSQDLGEGTLGTALAIPSSQSLPTGADVGEVYALDERPPDVADVARRCGGAADSTLLGFVIENSSVDHIRFETWRPDVCRQGLLVWSLVGQDKVFFQITDGLTTEEAMEQNRHGSQCAVASQLGVFSEGAGFKKYPWLPLMNSPVFCQPAGFGQNMKAAQEGDFVYGNLPGTSIRLGGPFCDAWDHHTAVIGVTGAGKTELAFDLLRHAVDAGIKVICIDLTARYGSDLGDLAPVDLSIATQLAEELSTKLFDAETGKFNAGEEKKVLQAFSQQLRTDVGTRLAQFLQGEEKLGLIALSDLSNSKASLLITEMYLSALLRFGREHRESCPRVLVVVEEAHTVMPETSTMGLGDFDSRGLVGKIAQIALQGRKYGIGLLIVAQRTANVSKTVLTQCNSIIALGCYDKTTVEYLSGMYGERYAQLVPQLPRLHAVGFGKAFRSERPVVFEIPYSETKAAKGRTTASPIAQVGANG